MPDKFFIDSNIALYLLDMNAATKKQVALKLIDNVTFISGQVIFECLNVCRKKLKYGKSESLSFLKFLMSASFIQPETEEVISAGPSLFEKFDLQVFDSKIIASALIAGCSILYSEDMQNGLVIDERLTIVNPFL